MNNLQKFALVFVVLWAILFEGGLVRAQTGTIDNVSLNYIEAVADDATSQITVNAYVSVVDDQGQPVANLPREGFEVFEDGRPVAITSVAVADDPIAVILVLDTSGSMAAIGQNGLPAIETAKQAAVSFIEGLDEGDEAAAFGFNDDVTLLADLTSDHNAVINSINQLTYKDFGGTCLYDASLEAVQKSAEVLQGRRAIIVLTDGVDEASQQEGACSLYTLADVVAEANERTSKVPIFAVGFGNVDERELLRMARLTGGQGFIGENVTDLSGLFDTIAQQLKGQYLVSYQTQAASGEHSIVVKVSSSGVSRSDERPVFVPAVQTQPTPTSPPVPTTAPAVPLTVAIVDAAKDQPEPGLLRVVVDINPVEQVTRSELFIDGVSMAVLQDPPFDVFTLPLSDLTSGEKTMRVEVTGQDGATASNERNITITLSPPAPLPTPAPTVAASPLQQFIPGSMTDPMVMILVAAACLISLIVTVVAYLLLGRKKQQPDEPPHAAGVPVEPAPVDIFVTQDEIEVPEFSGAADPYATIDEVIIKAELILLESVSTTIGETFPIRKPEVTIGRNANNIKNDINIPDPTVSRNHAKIVFDGSNFKIFNYSRNGVFVNKKMVGSDGEILPHGAEVRLGRKIRLQFKANDLDDDLFQTQDDINNDPDATIYSK